MYDERVASGPNCISGSFREAEKNGNNRAKLTLCRCCRCLDCSCDARESRRLAKGGWEEDVRSLLSSRVVACYDSTAALVLKNKRRRMSLLLIRVVNAAELDSECPRMIEKAREMTNGNFGAKEDFPRIGN